MRDFSKVSPSVWKSRKFTALGDDSDAKLAYHYVLSCPHATSAGCYDLPLGYGCADLGWTEERYRKALDRLCSVGLIAYDEAERTILITNWTAFNQPTNAKHALGMLGQLRQASALTLKIKAAQELKRAVEDKGFGQDKALAKAIVSFFEAYREPIATKTETRPRQDQTQTEPRNSAPTDCTEPVTVDEPDRHPAPSGCVGSKVDWDVLRDKLCDAAGWQAARANGRLEVVGPIAALIDAGADLDLDVLPVVRSLAAKCRAPNWKFFVPAIREAMQDRLSATAAPARPSGSAPPMPLSPERRAELARKLKE